MREWLDGLPDALWLYDGQPWWDLDAVVEGAPTSMRRAVIETPDRPAGDGFYHGILGSEAESDLDHTDHFWPGGVVRLIDAEIDRPQVAWIDVEGLGVEVAIGGTRFRPAQ